MQVIVVWGLLLLLALSTSASAGRLEYTTKTQRIITEDSLELFAQLEIPYRTPRAPLVLLLPMMGQTHSSYYLLYPAIGERTAHKAGESGAQRPYILNFDLRGHGGSTRWKDSTLTYRAMTPKDFARIPADVVEMTRHVLANYPRIDSNIVIIGASIGANVAVEVARLLPFVSTIVLLSPGEDYRGLKPAEALKQFDGRCLIVAAEDDTYSAASSRKLSELCKKCYLKIYGGSDHGTDIINNNSEAMTTVMDWLFGDQARKVSPAQE